MERKVDLLSKVHWLDLYRFIISIDNKSNVQEIETNINVSFSNLGTVDRDIKTWVGTVSTQFC